MSSHTDSDLLKQQYRDGTNLDARIALHAHYTVAAQNFHDWLLDHLDLPSDARILELGCGTGELWKQVRARVPHTWRVVLTDFSMGMVAGVRGIVETRHGASVQSDAQAIPFADETFDAVIANHMLYHVPDLPRALAEIRRVLKAGGALYAATNGAAHMHELNTLIRDSGIVLDDYWTLSFGLENGAALLAPYFASIERHDYRAELRVTELDLLMAYVRSMLRTLGMDEANLQRLRARASEIMAREGMLRIKKQSGLFIARKGAS